MTSMMNQQPGEGHATLRSFAGSLGGFWGMKFCKERQPFFGGGVRTCFEHFF